MTARTPPRTLVVVSYYDARPLAPLVDLLRQLRSVPAGAPFEVHVSVNTVTGRLPELPGDLAGTDIALRPNAGYNIGAWQAAWQARPDHDLYLFLQDECVLCHPGWLTPFQTATADPATGLAGEALFLFTSWRKVDRGWPEIRRRYEAMRGGVGVPAGYGPDHVQMTALAARREVLRASGGFLTGDDKAGACAGEILTSVRLRHMGYRNRQVAFRPYSHIRHPQWDDLTAMSNSLRWRLVRLARLGAGWLDEPGRRRRARQPWRTGADD